VRWTTNLTTPCSQRCLACHDWQFIDSPLSRFITTSLFHSTLKTFLFCKSFPPYSLPFRLHDWLHADSPDCLPILLSIGLSAFYCFLFWLRDPFSRFSTIPAHEKQTERQIETDRIAVTISHCRFMCSSCYGARLSGVVGINAQNDIDDVLQIAWRHQCTPCTIKNGTDTYSILTYLNVNRFSKLFYHWKGN